MSPDDFIAKWQGITLTERTSAQEHFIDLRRALGEKTPTEADPTGTRYAFETRTTKAEGLSTQGPSLLIVCERYPFVPGDVEQGVEITKATVGLRQAIGASPRNPSRSAASPSHASARSCAAKLRIAAQSRA